VSYVPPSARPCVQLLAVPLFAALHPAIFVGAFAPGVHLGFLLMPGQHSEDAHDHAVNDEILRVMCDRFGPEHQGYKTSKHYQDQHADVIRRFGRYPHRNSALGRESTPEERAWLAGYDKLPEWAKSQLNK
jgi:hypothetical protein